MKNTMFTAMVIASVAGVGTAFAQVPRAPNNSGIQDREAVRMMREKGMKVRVYDGAGTVYYDGDIQRMSRGDGWTLIRMPTFTRPAEEAFFEAPDSSERSSAK